MQQSFDDLRRGVVLAELGGHGNGPYCAKHGAGAALVVMGTYVVDAGESVAYPADFVFKPGRSNYAAYLEEHVAAARAGGARVGVSAISVDPADTVDFLQAAEAAGADYASLCAYSAMPMFTTHNLGVELCRRANRDLLRRWASGIAEGVGIPTIFKMGLDDPDETLEAIDTVVQAGVPIVHVAVDSTSPGSPDLAFASGASEGCPFLIVGGGIGDVDGARRVLAAGAGAVAIATAAMKDPDLCGRIQRALRAG